MNTLILFLGCTSLLLAQGRSATPVSTPGVRAIGVITRIDVAARSITIKTDPGPEMGIRFEEATRLLRVAPGAKDLSGAATIRVTDLSVGDRILARGQGAGDQNSLAADSIIVMSRADIAKKQAAERAAWEQRGVVGITTALVPASGEITIRAQTLEGTRPVAVSLAPGAMLRRYAPDSIRFSDAKPGRFEELKIGDQIKALGTSSEDRARFTAEELVSGSFRNLAATVISLDPIENTVQVTDLTTSRRLQVKVSPESTIRRLSPSVAQMIAVRISGGGTSAAPPQPRDLQSTIESLPPLHLADLKPGEAVVISSTNSEDPSRVTAITLLAGVEPLLKGSSRGGREINISSWNLDLSMSVGLP
jgi:hypothetical protein